MNRGERWLAIFGVERAERSLFLAGGLTLVLTGAAASALLNAAETLFLKRVGVETVPWALLATAVMLVATTALVARRIGEDRPRALSGVLAGLAIALVPLAALPRTESTLAYWALLLAARHVLPLALLAFFGAVADIVTTRQAKRLFPPLTAGITVGGIIGSFASDQIASVVGIDGLILVCAASLGAASVVARRLRASGPRRLAPSAVTLRAEVGAADDGPDSALGLWRESRLFRLLATGLICGGALAPVLYFQFSWVVDAATGGPDGEQALLALYAQFRGWLNVVLLVAQLWLSARLYRNFGLPAALALWPAAFVLGFGGLAIHFGLAVGLSSFAATRVAEYGVASGALRVLFNLFPESVRARASGLLEGPVDRTGSVLGNLGVLAAIAVGAGQHVSLMALPIAIVWLVAALLLWREFPGLLLQASAEHGLGDAGDDKATLLDARTVRTVASRLADDDPAVCRAALELLEGADVGMAAEALATAIATTPAGTRPLVVDALHRLVEPLAAGELRSASASDSVRRALAVPESLEPEERSDLLQVFARLTGGRSRAVANSTAVFVAALGDREASVRLAAMAELVRRRRAPRGVGDFDQVLRDSLAGSDVLMRRTARNELRAMLLSTEPDDTWYRRLDLLAEQMTSRADRAATLEALVQVARRQPKAATACVGSVARRVGDGDPRVRGAALRFLGHVGAAGHAVAICEALGSRHDVESDAAREALVALGADATGDLLSHRLHGPARERDAALRVLRELEVDRDVLEAAYREVLAVVRAAAVFAASIDDRWPAQLVRRRLEERIDEGVGTLLVLHAVLDAEPRIAALERRMRRAGDARRRDLVVETIEALLPAAQRARIVPLLDSAAKADRAHAAARGLGRELPSADQAWEELRGADDSVTARLAEAAALARSGDLGEDGRAMESVEIAVRLQAIGGFDRLSVPQLLRLADTLRDETFEPSESIFKEGDEGDSLYLILEGAVRLRKGAVELDRREAGDVFGDLAVLDAVPRAASASADGEARVLRIDRSSLLDLIDESPTLAVFLAQRLTARIRALQDRLVAQADRDS